MIKTIKFLFILLLFFQLYDHMVGVRGSLANQVNFDIQLDHQMDWLNAEAITKTEIATKTAMDVNLVPGMVTILKGYDLEKLGIHTVKEALSLVPGMEIGLEATVRGIAYESSIKIKALLNGVPVNNTFTGEFEFLYDIPIEQIERIEVIRGPGSALYGEWAYAGVINIITRTDKNKAFVRYGRFKNKAGGALLSHEFPEQELKVSLNIASWQKDKSNIWAEKDFLHDIGMEEISQAPGHINDSRETLNGIFNIKYKNLSLLAQLSSSRFGSYYGIGTGAIPPLDDNLTSERKNKMVQIGWNPKISENLEFNINAGLKQYIWGFDRIFMFPPGMVMQNQTGYYYYENGMQASVSYEENTTYGSCNFKWTGWNDHILLTGAEYSNIKMGDTWSEANYDPLTLEPLDQLYTFESKDSWLIDDQKRNIYSFFIQDQWNITNKFILSTGLRYDNYDDTDNRITPRIAAVYQASKNHIFKTQYSEAFRPPSFDEMHMTENNPAATGNPDLDAETVKTLEFEYIYKHKRFITIFTAYYLELNNLITLPLDTLKYENRGSADIQGMEFELKWNILKSLLMDFNFSLNDIKDNNSSEKIPEAASWYGNIGLMYQPSDKICIALKYLYVAEKERDKSTGDDRSPLNGYDTLDFTITLTRYLFNNISLAAGIKNMFNEDIKYPSIIAFNDYDQPGRQWWVRASYEF